MFLKSGKKNLELIWTWFKQNIAQSHKKGSFMLFQPTKINKIIWTYVLKSKNFQTWIAERIMIPTIREKNKII
jgi:hypothetical protein